MDQVRPRLDVTVYTDYVCPFCYVGDRRIRRLAEQFDVNITWRPVEIHPETPPEGMPLADLGYPPDVWEKMMMHLGNMAAEEDIPMAERKFTTNSHNALLLSAAARDQNDEVFELVHEGLFFTFFTQGKNIGDPKVLADIAIGAGMSPEDFDDALMNPKYEEALTENFVAARRHGVTGVPTFVINEHVVRGAVSLPSLLAVAEEVAVS